MPKQKAKGLDQDAANSVVLESNKLRYVVIGQPDTVPFEELGKSDYFLCGDSLYLKIKRHKAINLIAGTKMYVGNTQTPVRPVIQMAVNKVATKETI